MEIIENIITVLGVSIVVVAGLLVYAVMGATFGAFVGWILGMTILGTWIVETFASFGITGINMIHIGTTAGFISGFMKNSKSDSKD